MLLELRRLYKPPFSPFLLIIEFDNSDRSLKKAVKHATKLLEKYATAMQVETEEYTRAWLGRSGREEGRDCVSVYTDVVINWQLGPETRAPEDGVKRASLYPDRVESADVALIDLNLDDRLALVGAVEDTLQLIAGDATAHTLRVAS